MPKPKKHTALNALTKKRLLRLTRRFELEVPASRSKAVFVDTLARSRRASFTALLSELNRDELKSICRAHGLDDSGRKKATIIARLLGRQLPAASTTRSPADSEKQPRRERAQRKTPSEPNVETRAASLGFEDKLWRAADLLRSNMDPTEYKHVVLGLIFLKYISDAFTERENQLIESVSDPNSDDYVSDPQAREVKLGKLLENRDVYTAEKVFWVPREARWPQLQAFASQPTIGARIDEAMDAIEQDNRTLKGALPKIYGRPSVDKSKLGALVNLIGSIGLGAKEQREKDTLGRVYEYFLSRFASAEGKGGGEFYTPSSVVQVIVEMLEPYTGRVYDPCCGSGGMFVQSMKFIKAHDGNRDAVSIYGQESNPTTWRMARMNLAIRGIEAKLGSKHADSFHDDQHPDLRADFVMANPPFNISEWGGERLVDDARWAFGAPPPGNANFAWLQHIVHHLAPGGRAGIVLANGSMSSMSSGRSEIRRKLIEADVVDCMVAMPSQLFYATGISVCLWLLARDRSDGKRRARRGEVLFIDARRLGRMETRVHRVFDAEHVERIAATYHAWRSRDGGYKDVAGFCRAVGHDVIAEHGFVLTPGRYVGAVATTQEREPFRQKLPRLIAELTRQQQRARTLDAAINAVLETLEYDR